MATGVVPRTSRYYSLQLCLSRRLCWWIRHTVEKKPRPTESHERSTASCVREEVGTKDGLLLAWTEPGFC